MFMVYTTHLWIFMVHLGMVYYCCTYIRIIRCFCLRVLIHQTRGFLRKSPRSMGISTYSHSLVTKHQTSSNFDSCKSYLPSGKHTKTMENSLFFMGQVTISMVIFRQISMTSLVSNFHGCLPG